MCMPQFVLSPVHGLCGCYQFLVIMIKLCMNIGVHIFGWICCIFEKIPKSGIVGPFGKCMFNSSK